MTDVFNAPQTNEDRVKEQAAGIANSFGPRTDPATKKVLVCGQLVLDGISNRDTELREHIEGALGDRKGEARKQAFIELPALRTLRAMNPELAGKVGERNPAVAEMLKKFDQTEANGATAVTAKPAPVKPK